MATLTKAQKVIAMEVLVAMDENRVPQWVTPREASRLCEKFGVTNDRFRRVAKREQDFRLIALAKVAVEIAKKGGRA
jgi:hypothetical protein